MRNLVRSTFHFHAHGPGDKPEESGVRQDLVDTVNMLGIGTAEMPGPDQRAIKALTDGFTFSQYQRARKIIDNAITERRERHTGQCAGYSTAVLEQLAQIEARWRLADAAVVRLVADAEVVHVTGLELNSAERTAAMAAGDLPADAA